MIGKGHEALEESYTDDITLPPPSDQPVVLKAAGCRWPAAFATSRSRCAPAKCSASTASWAAGSSSWRGRCSASSSPTAARLRSAATKRPSRSTADARRAGIAFVPESRRAMLFHQEPVYKNISISILDRISPLLLKPSRERVDRRAGRSSSCRSGRRPSSSLLGMLSGGNQQKVALAKWLTYPPRVLVLCEPTRGMDVGAKNDVVNIVRGLRAQGLAIVVLSTEPETVLSLADRILVMKRGAVVREFADETVSKDRLLEAA